MLLWRLPVIVNCAGVQEFDERDVGGQCSRSCLFSQVVGQVLLQPSGVRCSTWQEQLRTSHRCVVSLRCIIDRGGEL